MDTTGRRLLLLPLAWSSAGGPRQQRLNVLLQLLLSAHETCLFSLLWDSAASWSPPNVRVRLVHAEGLLISQWRICTASPSRTHTFLRLPISQWGERSKCLQSWGWKKETQTFLVSLFHGQERFYRRPLTRPLATAVGNDDWWLALDHQLSSLFSSRRVPAWCLWRFVSPPAPNAVCVESWTLFPALSIKEPHPVYKLHSTPDPHTLVEEWNKVLRCPDFFLWHLEIPIRSQSPPASPGCTKKAWYSVYFSASGRIMDRHFLTHCVCV